MSLAEGSRKPKAGRGSVERVVQEYEPLVKWPIGGAENQPRQDARSLLLLTATWPSPSSGII